MTSGTSNYQFIEGEPSSIDLSQRLRFVSVKNGERVERRLQVAQLKAIEFGDGIVATQLNWVDVPLVEIEAEEKAAPVKSTGDKLLFNMNNWSMGSILSTLTESVRAGSPDRVRLYPIPSLDDINDCLVFIGPKHTLFYRQALAARDDIVYEIVVEGLALEDDTIFEHQSLISVGMIPLLNGEMPTSNFSEIARNRVCRHLVPVTHGRFVAVTRFAAESEEAAQGWHPTFSWNTNDANPETIKWVRPFVLINPESKGYCEMAIKSITIRVVNKMSPLIVKDIDPQGS